MRSEEYPLAQRQRPGELSSDVRSSDARYTPPIQAPAPEFGVRYVRELLRRRWWQILIVAVPVIAATATYTALSPRLYESEATFLIESLGRGGGPGSSLELLDRIGRISRLENEIELLQSRRVLAPAANRLDLHATVELDGRLVPADRYLVAFDATEDARPGTYRIEPTETGAVLKRNPSPAVLAEGEPGDTVTYEGLRFAVPESVPDGLELLVQPFPSAVAALERATEVQQAGREADLVRLTCTASDPTTAYTLCVEVSSSYLELRDELQVTEARNAKTFLTDATERIRTQLTEAEDSLADYSERFGAVALGARAEAEVRNVADLASQRDAKRAERAALREFLGGIEGSGGGSARYRELAGFPTFLENDAITQMVASLIALDNQRAELAVLRSDENAELASLNARIATIEGQLQSMAQAYERALTSQITSLDQALASANQRVTGIPVRQVELARRERAVEQLESMYGELEGRLREAELAEGVGVPNVRSIDEPEIPIRPSHPSVARNLLLGTSLALAMGFLFAVYREMTDSRIHHRTQVELASGLRVVGMLPTVRDTGPLLGSTGERTAGIIGERNSAAVAPPGWSPKEWQPAVEAFRSLVADLKVSMHLTNGSRSPRSIAVMSSAQGEGKTYTACNLALVWASMGEKTLLIDADFRMARMAKFFNLSAEAYGLSDILAGAVNPKGAYQAVRTSGGHQLQVLTAGSEAESQAHLLHTGQRLKEALDHFKRQFDVVIIDTPPLNVVSDSTILAAAVDAIVMIVRSGSTRPDALEQALQRLHHTRGNVVGLVMNDVELPSYYKSYYGSRGG